jgi:hypothetical protein
LQGLVQLFERRRVRDGQCSTDPWDIVNGNLNSVLEFAGMDLVVLLLATVTYEDTLSSIFQEMGGQLIGIGDA